jgi:hypothetical protein
MRGGIDHLMINANNYDKALGFYGWLMPKIGYPQSLTFGEPSPMTGYYGDSGSLWIVTSTRHTATTPSTKAAWACARSRFAPIAAGKLTISPAKSRLTADASLIRRVNTTIGPATTRSSSPIPMALSSKWCTTPNEPCRAWLCFSLGRRSPICPTDTALDWLARRHY